MFRYCVVKNTTIIIDASENDDNTMYLNASYRNLTNNDVEILSNDEYVARVASDIDSLKIKKRTKLNVICTDTINGKFSVLLNGKSYLFSYDSEAQKRFNGIGTMMYCNKIDSVEWTAYDGDVRVRITLDPTLFDIVAMSALKHQNDNIVKFNNLLIQLESATTVDEVNAISW